MRVVILGSASSSLRLIPWDEPDVEFWAGASFFKFHPNFASLVTHWFEIHPNIERLREEWLGWAVENQVRCYLQDKHSELENSQAYPIDEMVEQFGRYLTSTVAYMLALAISKGATEIGCFGVNMSSDTEYFRHRPCFEYFAGLARGMGIRVHVAGESPLLQSSNGLYGYDYLDPFPKVFDYVETQEQEARKWAI